MNIVFFGSSDFALLSLKAIYHSRHKILKVVTAEDKPKGRNLKLQTDPVKAFALEHKILVWQPSQVKDKNFLEDLKQLKADFFVVVSYGKILPNALLEIPKMTINVHPSLLPEYRGASPVPYAILEGKKETGVSIARVTEKLDSGEILLQEKIKLSGNEESSELLKRLGEMGAKLLVQALDLLEKNKIQLKTQSEVKVTYARKFKKEDGTLDLQKSADELSRHIRAMKPWPSSFILFQGKQLKILKAKELSSVSTSKKPGTILEIKKGSSFVIQTGDGALEILELQVEGKKPSSGFAFVNGHRLQVGSNILS